MKSLEKNNLNLENYYKPIDKFLFRTPFYSEDKLFAIEKAEDLKQICQTSVFQEALFVASPVLYEETQKWVNGKVLKKKEEDKLIFSLLKYYSRMCTRSTCKLPG